MMGAPAACKEKASLASGGFAKREVWRRMDRSDIEVIHESQRPAIEFG
jgi:hypothetical protein